MSQQVNRFPENCAPAGPGLKGEVFAAADAFIRMFGNLTVGPRGGQTRQCFFQLYGAQVPSFVARRLPERTETPDTTNYMLDAHHRVRRRLPIYEAHFVGKILIERDCVYDSTSHRIIRVAYHINSLRNHLIRRIEAVEYKQPPFGQAPLEITQPPSVAAEEFPKRVAVTEAWQLIRLLDSPLPYGFPPLPDGGGSFGN